MLQSAAVWRLTHTADRITKSKYENHCCSPEPSVHRTRQWAGELVQGRSWQECRMTHYTVGAAAYGCGNTLWQDFVTRNVHKVWTTKTKVVVVESSARNYLQISKHTVKSVDLINCLELLQVMQVCFKGKKLPCLFLSRCIKVNAQQAAANLENALLTCQLVWIYMCQYCMNLNRTHIMTALILK